MGSWDLRIFLTTELSFLLESIVLLVMYYFVCLTTLCIIWMISLNLVVSMVEDFGESSSRMM